MNRSLRKITFIFFFIALVPVSFIIYELSSLNENEQIIRRAYENQLDAILFSVNQYADDLTSSWANKVSLALQEHPDGELDSAMTITNINSLYGVYMSDMTGRNNLYTFPVYADEPQFQADALAKLEARYAGNIAKLAKYYDAGFRKMEPMDTVLSDRFIPVMFVLDREIKSYRVAILLFDIPAFIQNNLGPKMQEVAQEKFYIAVFKRGQRDVVYSTAALVPGQDSVKVKPAEQDYSRNLWLLPEYSLSISLSDATINDLVRDRTQTSLIILILLLLVLLGGIIFLYRNIRAEIRLSQAKTEFVSNVSHEIRTPLALISMYAETLELNRVTEEKKKEYYSIISNETARLSGIVNRILNFSKMDANKKEYDLRLEDLNEVCGKVLKSFSHQLERGGFTLEFIRDEDVPMVKIDYESVSEALVNLLDNAMKYSGKVKHIQVRTGSDAGRAFIEVKDEGIGIPRAYQKDIFEQFYRAPMGNVHNTKGSGLGLSLVKKTMSAHRGEVTVESSMDKGSTFRLLFPILPGKV
jgi:two-component system, OmpR family, phosphate regulon sensor histidine kinase PhoR